MENHPSTKTNLFWLVHGGSAAPICMCGIGYRRASMSPYALYTTTMRQQREFS